MRPAREPITVENKLTALLASEKHDLLNIYCTAGYPRLEDTTVVLSQLSCCGVDMIELGIPFSDPLADGPVIQASNQVALDNGMSLKVLFAQLASFDNNQETPLILMGYLNPILQFGIEEFCASCAKVGVDGVILPDLPLDIYLENYASVFAAHSVSFIFLITPETDEERIRQIDDASTAFIYAVSSSSTTGTRSGIDDAQSYLAKLSAMSLKHPVLTGFNIRDRASFKAACTHTRGGIIGSAFIKSIKDSDELEARISSFIQSLK